MKRIGWFGKTMIVIGIIAVIMFALIIRATCFNRWEVKTYEQVTLQNSESMALNCTQSELITMVDNLFDTPHFVARTGKRMQNLPSSSCLFRIVFIPKDASGEDLVLLYAHELSHIKFFSTSETYVSFKTFQTLYESDNAILRNVAERYAYKVVTLGHEKGTKADCGYYILNYLNK